MRLPRVDDALETCENHLNSTQSFGTEIERLLTYSLLVVTYAEFEQAIESIVQEKCAAIPDEAIRNFVESSIGMVSRSIRPDDLAGLLNRFGDGYRAAFRMKTNNSADAVVSYNNLIANRHLAAHSTGTTVTFQEVKTFYREGHVVLDFFRDTLLAFGAGSG